MSKKEDRSNMLEFYKALYDDALIPISILNQNFKVLWSNQKAENLLNSLDKNALSIILTQDVKTNITERISQGNVFTICLQDKPSKLEATFSCLYSFDKNGEDAFDFIIASYTEDASLAGSNFSAIESASAKIMKEISNIDIFRNSILARLDESETKPNKEITDYFDKITSSSCNIIKTIKNLSYYSSYMSNQLEVSKDIIECSQFLDGFFFSIKNKFFKNSKQFNYFISLDGAKYIQTDCKKLEKLILTLINLICKDEGAEIETATVKEDLDGVAIEFSLSIDKDNSDFISKLKQAKPNNYDADDIPRIIFCDCLIKTSCKANYEIINEEKAIINLVFPTCDLPIDITSPISAFSSGGEYIVDKFSSINVELSDLFR